MEKNIDYIIKNCKATLKIEGLKPSRQAENINRLFLEGKITSNTAIEQIIKYHLGGEN
ncbi:MAG: antitoxin VbhA family protein [Fusobacteriaceae bacterium]|nr:antitoxin VbhA family protein [Fusobacteriaceae bacterium]